MKDRRQGDKPMKNPGTFSWKPCLAGLLLAAACGVPTKAQNVSEVSQIDLGGGVTLDSALTSRQDPDPVDIFLKLDGINGNVESRTSITVIARGVPASNRTPAGMTAATTVLASYAVLAGTVTPNYATHVALASDEVVVSFLQGDPDQPILIGGVFSGGSGGGKVTLSDFAIAKVLDTASPSFFQNVVSPSLVVQFGLANPLVPAASPACVGIATQLDVDSNGNLLIRVFQGSNDAPFPGVSVIVSVTSTTGTAQFEAVSDANGLAQFNGPGNAVALNSQNTITGISLQFSNEGAAVMCVVQGNPNPPCDTSTVPPAVAQTTAAP